MKTIRLACITVSAEIIYRSNWFLGIFIDLLSMGLLLVFWNAALGDRGLIGTYDFAGFFNYFFLVTIMQKIIITDSGSKISDDILTGRLSFLLLKLVSHHKIYISRDLQVKFENIIQTVAMIILYLIIAVSFNLGTGLHFSIFIIPAVLNAIILAYLIQYITGMIAFWTNSAWALLLALTVFNRVFNGQMFPIDIVPEGYRIIFTATPFYYTVYFPVSLLMNKGGSPQYVLTGLATGIAWILALVVLCRVLFRIGMKRYEAAGI